VKGSGRVQMVGIDGKQMLGIGGKQVLKTKVSEGKLFIMPRFFLVSKNADPKGHGVFLYHHYSKLIIIH
jgi:hypothetical protein